MLVKVRVVGDGPSSVRPWQESRVVAGRSPVFDLELIDIEIVDISVDKLQLVAWDVSNGQEATNGPGGQNTNFLGEVSQLETAALSIRKFFCCVDTYPACRELTAATMQLVEPSAWLGWRLPDSVC